MSTANTKRFLTIPKAARETGMSVRFLRQLHRSGRLPGLYVGERFMVNMPALAAAIDEKCREDSRMPAVAGPADYAQE